jgi:hypothetical protein
MPGVQVARTHVVQAHVAQITRHRPALPPLKSLLEEDIACLAAVLRMGPHLPCPWRCGFCQRECGLPPHLWSVHTGSCGTALRATLVEVVAVYSSVLAELGLHQRVGVLLRPGWRGRQKKVKECSAAR